MAAERPARRLRGGQPGNTNALKHGLYAQALTRAQADLAAQAAQLHPLDLEAEIALLRSRIATLLQAEPDNAELLFEGIRTLARIAATHAALTRDEEDELGDTVRDVLSHFAKLLPQEA
jgi:hypothetical protein